MKKLKITYSTAKLKKGEKLKNGKKIVRKSCHTVWFGDDRVADCLLNHDASDSDGAVADLEKYLRVVERFKGRYYIPGSIKHCELVEG